jgi:putative peptidoglycan lipid II flippase
MAEETPRQPSAKTGKAAAIVGVAVMCSRVLGLVREVAFTTLFGTHNMSIFIASFRIPNLLRDLFAEGALSTAFITVFSRKIAKEGDESAWRLAHKIGTLTLVVMSLITMLGMYFSPSLVGLIAGGFTGEDAALTASLTATMFPFILMVSVAAQVMGMLNSKHVFGWPAMASSFFNIGSIVGGLTIGWFLDHGFGRTALYGLAYGTLIGGFLQLAVQIPPLLRAGYRPRLDFNFRDPAVVEVLAIMAPAVIAAAAVQVNVMVNTSFAADLRYVVGQEGAIAWLNNAFRLMQLPLGVFGVAIATVSLPLLSKNIALGNRDEFRKNLARGIRLVFFLTIPASVGLWLLGEPIMSVIYEHGSKVTRHDIVESAHALRWYALGLAAYAGMKVLAPAFYALDLRKTPMMVSFFSIALNYGLNALFVSMGMGHQGLAMSTGCVALTNFALLYWLMRRSIGSMESKRLLITLAKVFLATDALALVCLAGDWLFFAKWDRMNFFIKCLSLSLTIGIGMAAFVAVASALKLREMKDVVDVVNRKLSRRLRPKVS